jgi:hypothetical protein
VRTDLGTTVTYAWIQVCTGALLIFDNGIGARSPRRGAPQCRHVCRRRSASMQLGAVTREGVMLAEVSRAPSTALELITPARHIPT